MREYSVSWVQLVVYLYVVNIRDIIMKRILSTKVVLVLLLLLLMHTMTNAQQNKYTKDLYLSYFGNDSTSLNILLAPCYSADLYLLLSGVIYNKDTITINGKQYYYREPQPLESFSQPEYHFLFPRLDTLFLREERETGRLYRYYRDYFGMGEAEKLICDMSIEVGETFIVPSHNCLEEVGVEVKSIDYNNGEKTIHLYGNIDFVEGRFPGSFPLWQEPLSEMSSGEYQASQEIDLLCVHKDGIQIYGDQDDCFPNLLSFEETDDNHLTIYPNVIKNNDVITIENSGYIKDITMTDMFGKIKDINKNEIYNNRWQIRFCNNCEKGMYFIIIQTEIGISYAKVLVVD